MNVLKAPEGITKAELKRLLKAATEPRFKVMVKLAYRFAMRNSEICNLRRADTDTGLDANGLKKKTLDSFIDLASKTITVRRLKASQTTVHKLSDKDCKMLTDLITSTPRESAFVFIGQRCNNGDAPIDRSTFYRLFRKAAEAAKLPAAKHHPHCLKHGTGLLLAESGANQATIMAMMGHKTLAASAVYLKPSTEYLDKMHAKIFGD